jgi:hypothetical protein
MHNLEEETYAEGADDIPLVHRTAEGGTGNWDTLVEEPGTEASEGKRATVASVVEVQ